MVASYLLSSTLVPVLSVWLMRHKGEHAAEGRVFSRLLGASAERWRRRSDSAGSLFRDTSRPAGCCSGWSARRLAESFFHRLMPANS